MIKKIMTGVLCLLLVACSSEASKNLNKKIVHGPYGNSETVYKYDSKNNLIEMSEPNGAITTYVYDDDGLLVEVNSGSVKIKYTYDNGNMVLKETFNNDMLISKFEAEYQNDLLITSTESLSGIMVHCQYEYNNANLKTMTTCMQNNVQFSSESAEYDEKGNLIKLTTVDENGQMTVQNYSYQTDGKINEILIEYEDGKTQKLLHEYSGKSLSKVYIEQADGTKTLFEEYIY